MSKLPFVVAADVEGEERIPKRVSKLLLAPKTVGTRNVSMGLNVTAVGSMIPDHVHEDSEEVMFIISGRARSNATGHRSQHRSPVYSYLCTPWRPLIEQRAGIWKAYDVQLWIPER